MHSRETVAEAVRLLAEGLNPTEVARRLELPRSTVENWRRRGTPRQPEPVTEWTPPSAETYCYVLGLYLGDGCISRSGRRSHFLRLYLDDAYPAVISEAAEALSSTLFERSVRRYDYGREQRTILHISHPALLFAFPQHGPGRKHERKIELAPWQRELTVAHPAAVIRGLIHSDGCRSVNRFKVKLPSGRVAEYEYPRYFFSNLSADIRAIFVEHCDLLGIRCTLGHHRNVSVSHRKSVAILEELVGPKS